VAILLGKEKMSPQAVGQAVGANPVGIIFPCHRVLGTGGRLTGYAWGSDMKAWLLAHENIPYK
jgi:methylated-DNA-[protein]-cysteine S-methyltransferase